MRQSWVLLAVVPACSLVAHEGLFEFRPLDAGRDAELDATEELDVGADTVEPQDVGGDGCRVDSDCPPLTNTARVRCELGVCRLDSCHASFADCNGIASDGCEIDTRSDLTNCGECGASCEVERASTLCVDSMCVLGSCVDGYGDCNNELGDGCESLLETADHCGTCGSVCAGDLSVCDVSTAVARCVEACSAPAALCGPSCVDTETNVRHCGECHRECDDRPNASATCDASQCGYRCHSGFADCDGEAVNGCEVDITSSSAHCGSCNAACAGDRCSMSRCGGIVEVAAGSHHSCARHEDGLVQCWSAVNTHGQLGTGAFVPSALPSLVLDDEGSPFVASSVAAGAQVTCASRMADGLLFCWGRNDLGQRGRSSLADAPSPEAVTSESQSVAFAGERFVSIDGFSSHFCALSEVGNVWCWGNNASGQVGLAPNPDPVREAVQVPLSGFADAVRVGDNHSCARLVDGTLRCWGSRSHGQLGGGVDGGASHLPVDPLQDGSVVTSFDAGSRATCASIEPTGSLLCWGEGTDGQLGVGSEASHNRPQLVAGLSGVTSVTMGDLSSCARASNGDFCWGRAANAQLGNGLGPSPTPQRTPSSIALPAGAGPPQALVTSACAKSGAGGLLCWGDNQLGQLGIEDTIRRTPTALRDELGSLQATSIDTSEGAGCAVIGGDVRCFGANSGEVLGRGPSASPTARPRAIQYDFQDATAVSMGFRFGCALDQGTALCWGSANFGQLGDGMPSRQTATPVEVALAGSVDEIKAGFRHACARQGTTMRCWGRNVQGELGSPPPLTTSTPQLVGVPNVALMALGNQSTCVVRTDRTVACWGRNAVGQLGNGSSTSTHVPQETGLSDVIALSAGAQHYCAIVQRSVPEQGEIFCWGLGSSGQLGAGSMDTANDTPQALMSVHDDFISVAASADHTCAVRASGELYCWGLNDAHQLGDGSRIDSSVPVRVPGVDEAVAVFAGGLLTGHSCALLSNGTAACWGVCLNGRCGTGEAVLQPTPTLVLGL